MKVTKFYYTLCCMLLLRQKVLLHKLRNVVGHFSCVPSINFGSNHRFFLAFHIACHSQINKNSENDSYNNNTNERQHTVQLTWQRVNVNFSFLLEIQAHTSLYNKCLTQYVVKRKSQCFHSSSFAGFHPTNGEWEK